MQTLSITNPLNFCSQPVSPNISPQINNFDNNYFNSFYNSNIIGNLPQLNPYLNNYFIPSIQNNFLQYSGMSTPIISNISKFNSNTIKSAPNITNSDPTDKSSSKIRK